MASKIIEVGTICGVPVYCAGDVSVEAVKEFIAEATKPDDLPKVKTRGEEVAKDFVHSTGSGFVTFEVRECITSFSCAPEGLQTTVGLLRGDLAQRIDAEIAAADRLATERERKWWAQILEQQAVNADRDSRGLTTCGWLRYVATIITNGNGR